MKIPEYNAAEPLGKTVLLDFYASWCAHCKRQEEILERFAETHPDTAIRKIDVERQTDLSEQYKIRSLPTLAVVKDGDITARASGVQSAERIEQMLE